MQALKLEPPSAAFQPGDGVGPVPVQPAIEHQPPLARLILAAVRRHAVQGLLVGALAALAILAGPRLLFGPRVTVTPVVRSDFVQWVVASGHVEAPHRVSIGTRVVGMVKAVPVSEGQFVQAGQLLIELESSEWTAAVAQADAAVDQAEARLRLLREVQARVAQQNLRQAQVSADLASAQLRRNTELLKQGFIGQAALDELKKTFELSEAQVRSARSQLASALPGGSDHAVATTALAEARAASAAARSRLRYATVRAPAAGTLIDRAVEPGDVVQPGKALMVLSPAGETQLVVQIDEKNLQLLSLGQQAQASADAYPEQRFAAELAYITPGVDVQRGSIEVKLNVPRPPAYLRQDMTVSVDIRAAFHPQMLLVASDAVRWTDRGTPWVLKVEGHRANRQAVRLGSHAGGLSEVLEGLQAGDLVVPASTPGIGDGSRLRPVLPPGDAR